MTLIDKFTEIISLQNSAKTIFEEFQTELIIKILQSHYNVYNRKLTDSKFTTGLLSLGAMLLLKKHVTLSANPSYSEMTNYLAQCIKITPTQNSNQKSKILKLLYHGDLKSVINFMLN